MSSAQVIQFARLLQTCVLFGFWKGPIAAGCFLVLFRLAYLTVTNAFAALQLLLVGDREKDAEILAPRHQVTVLERQFGADIKVEFAPEDHAFLAALLTSLPAGTCAGCGFSCVRIPSFAGTAIC
jgi:hypothetical protein